MKKFLLIALICFSACRFESTSPTPTPVVPPPVPTATGSGSAAPSRNLGEEFEKIGEEKGAFPKGTKCERWEENTVMCSLGDKMEMMCGPSSCQIVINTNPPAPTAPPADTKTAPPKK